MSELTLAELREWAENNGYVKLDGIGKALADIVKKAMPIAEDDDGFITRYEIPVGPIHRAIPILDQLGIDRAQVLAAIDQEDTGHGIGLDGCCELCDQIAAFDQEDTDTSPIREHSPTREVSE